MAFDRKEGDVPPGYDQPSSIAKNLYSTDVQIALRSTLPVPDSCDQAYTRPMYDADNLN